MCIKKVLFLVIFTSTLSISFVFAADNCGLANGKSFDSLTSRSPDLCSNGRVYAFSSVYSSFKASGWKWKCLDGSKFSSINSDWCLAEKTQSNNVSTNKYCGFSPDQSFSSIPNTGLCTLGTVANISENQNQYTWSCKFGSTIVSDCSVLKNQATPINGKCGSSNNQVLESIPTNNLCSTGTASNITGSGPWNWTCLGENKGTNENCLAQKKQIISNEKYKIPVLVVKYFPLDKNGLIDKKLTGDCYWLSSGWDSLDAMRQKVNSFNKEAISVLENGSKQYGYKDVNSIQSLDYEIVGTVEYLEPMPTIKNKTSYGADYDYNKIIQSINGKDWIENKGVKEIWIWGYHTPNTSLNESNMAGPYGNISNSYRLNDMPVYSKTYTVYHYNYTRGVPEVIENHTHQIEAIFGHVNYNVFWNEFVGTGSEPFGCGWTHCPPNVMSSCSSHEYDWTNEASVLSYCGGSSVSISCHTWAGSTCDNDGGLKYKTWWMQNIPQQWWAYIGDFDNAKRNNIGLTSIK